MRCEVPHRDAIDIILNVVAEAISSHILDHVVAVVEVVIADMDDVAG